MAVLYVAAVQQKMGISVGVGDALHFNDESAVNDDLTMMVAWGWDLLKSGQIESAMRMARRALDVNKSVGDS